MNDLLPLKKKGERKNENGYKKLLVRFFFLLQKLRVQKRRDEKKEIRLRDRLNNMKIITVFRPEMIGTVCKITIQYIREKIN